MTDRSPHVAIVGAGVAGLGCARALHEAGVPVTVFDKGRGPGGRISTRRGDIAFDHGAQYFTVTDDHFRATVDRWLRQNVVAEWQGHVVAIDRPGVIAQSSRHQRYVGVPGMNAVAVALAQSLDVRCGVTVAPPSKAGGGWVLTDVDARPLGTFETLVITAPPTQTAALLGAHPLGEVVGEAEMAPCLTVMAAWDDDLDLGFDGAFVNHGPLAWVARNGSKPGRHHPHSWVLHASREWSAEHLDTPADTYIDHLLAAFAEAVGLEDMQWPSHVAGHRWLYALPTQPLDTRCLWDPSQRVAVAGDWCGGPKVEGAWLSGRAAARRILDVP